MTALPAPQSRRVPRKLWLGYLGLSLLISLVCAIVGSIPLFAVNDEQVFFSVVLVLLLLGAIVLATIVTGFLLAIVAGAAGALGALLGAVWELVAVALAALLIGGLAALLVWADVRGMPPLLLSTAMFAGAAGAVVLTIFTAVYRRGSRPVSPA